MPISAHAIHGDELHLASVDAALARVERCARPLAPRATPLDAAEGQVLARAVLAAQASPAADVAAMDGYAVRDADLAAGAATLKVIGQAFAGQPFEGALSPGTCVRIFTGAQTPAGADRVVIQENARQTGWLATLRAGAADKRHIRAAGSDFRPGDVLVEAGQTLTAPRLVAAAAADVAHVDIVPRPRVAILASGDELRAPGDPARLPASVPDTVSLGVAAMIRAFGGEADRPRRLRDDLPDLRQAAAAACEVSDLVVVTGGASVGARDHARTMFEPLGLELIFSKVALRPGKPVWLGRAGRTLVLGLPGNPTAAMVTARLFLVPLVAGLAGRPPRTAMAWGREPLAGGLEASGEWETYILGQSTKAGVAPAAVRDSSSQAALGRADVLIRRRPGAPAAAAGALVETLALAGWRDPAAPFR